MFRGFPRKPSSQPRVAIIGAGIIGLSLAFELVFRRGTRVTLFDTRTRGRGASWAAAGMIAPAFEAAAEEGVHPRLFDLCLESAKLWPDFAADIERLSGLPSGFEAAPALAVALDEGEATHLAAISQVLAARGVAHRALNAGELAQMEPALSPDVLGGLELETDTRVDNRRTVRALLAALEASPRVTFVSGPAPLKSRNGRVHLEGHDAIVAAAGWETSVIKVDERGQLYSLVNWDTALDDIDCHAGQMLSVVAGPGAPQRVVRAGHVYLVPREGHVVIGATMEPDRVIDAPEADVIEALRLEGVKLCPALAGAAVTESWAGVRPGTPDHAPFLGETVTPGLYVAAGHYRNGILLAPVTAQILADQIFGQDTGELAAAFTTRRAYSATA
ncbi:putative glycine oxidase [Hyphomonas neptunium ATCC 15444]|uniref:Putative glycine oxidase n=2 Tax=Hyphomonas TaxID=85 RepID=Q0BYS2_HYPNA|nr:MULTISPECIES: glycine oxidase ThiO [Hyphomonas]ABI77881.1 putative glycine oxidase [Hyphomonas neptunium ATCC 15444]KCZ91498.1 putative glycine oxidase [Hyphomonas hirschiana VP5]